MTVQGKKLTIAQRWLLAIRPKTLTAALAPVLAAWGLAYRFNQFRIWPALAALFGAVMIQIGTNLVNDVVDYAKGADTQERLGPLRVTQAGLLTPRQVWSGAIASFVLAAMAGIYLITIGGWPILVIGLVSVLAGIAYTSGPFPLAYNGLGDLFVMIFFGFVAVGGTVFVVAGEIPPATWWVGLAIGALVTNILVVNNIRDLESDRRAGRRNIPVLFGRGAAELEFGALLLIAYLVPFVMLAYSVGGGLLAILTLPLGLRLYRLLRAGTEGRVLNPLLAQCGQLAFLYASLMALGLVIETLV